MKHNFHKNCILPRIFLVVLVFITSASQAEDQPLVPTAPPVLWAKPVNQGKGLGKILGKTMKIVSLKDSGRLFHNNSRKENADLAAPETSNPKLFDPKRNESPIRTARLFRIQINPPEDALEAVPVN